MMVRIVVPSLVAGLGVLIGLVWEPIVGAALVGFAALLPLGLRPRTQPRAAPPVPELEFALSPSDTSAAEEWWSQQRSESLPPPSILTEEQARVQQLAEERCDKVWAKIGEGGYFDEGTGSLDHAAIWKEIEEAVAEVATVYGRASDGAFMNARVGDITLAFRSVAAELLEMSRVVVPMVDLRSKTPVEVISFIRRAEKVGRGLGKASDIYRYAKPVVYGARVVLLGASLPTLAAFWAADELTRPLQRKILRWGSEKVQALTVRKVVNQSIAMIYRQAALMYRPGGQRTPAWYVLAEACAIVRAAPGIDVNRKKLLQQILGAPIHDEYERLDLIRALADDSLPTLLALDDRTYADHTPVERMAIAHGLSTLLGSLRGLNLDAARDAIKATETRLGWGLFVDFRSSGQPLEAAALDGLGLLDVLLRGELGLSGEVTRDRLAETDLWKRLEKQPRLEPTPLYEAARRQIGEVDGSGPIVAPRSLVGTDLAYPVVHSSARILSSRESLATDRADLLLTQIAQSLLSGKELQASLREFDKLCRTTLMAMVTQQGGADLPPPADCRAALRVSRQEAPFLMVSRGSLPDGTSLWVALAEDRVCLGPAAGDEHRIDCVCDEWPIEQVSFFKQKSRVASGLLLCRGAAGVGVCIPGQKVGTFDGLFRPALTALDIDTTKLEERRQEGA